MLDLSIKKFGEGGASSLEFSSERENPVSDAVTNKLDWFSVLDIEITCFFGDIFSFILLYKYYTTLTAYLSNKLKKLIDHNKKIEVNP